MVVGRRWLARAGRPVSARIDTAMTAIATAVAATVGCGCVGVAAAAPQQDGIFTPTPTDDQRHNRETPVPPKSILSVPQYRYIKARESTMPLYPDDSANGHCERDPWASNFQQCLVYSPAMGRNIPIHFKPATRGSHSALVLLDGASAVDNHNRWIYKAGAPDIFANTNINVILPIGGGPSWYADWQYPNCSLLRLRDNPQMWETFLTAELPVWGKRATHIHPRLYSVAGFSMGVAMR